MLSHSLSLVAVMIVDFGRDGALSFGIVPSRKNLRKYSGGPSGHLWYLGTGAPRDFRTVNSCIKLSCKFVFYAVACVPLVKLIVCLLVCLEAPCHPENVRQCG
jgi:hypothetical protein